MITEEQKQFKRGKIEASQVAAAIGISPFQTPAELAMELLGRVRPPEENAAMRGGNIMEPAIAQLYMDQEKVQIHLCSETYVHPHFDWLIAHPDYYYNDENEIKPICLIEIKNVGARQRFRWADGVPVHVVAQCVLQSLLTGINRVEVVAYFGGNDLEIYPLDITAKQQESLLMKLVLSSLKSTMGNTWNFRYLSGRLVLVCSKFVLMWLFEIKTCDAHPKEKSIVKISNPKDCFLITPSLNYIHCKHITINA